MSYQAIAGALARRDLSTGERLAAFSLASFADREHRARPGTPAAAARAGLERSGYLEARGRLERRGLAVVESPASGRGRASTLWLPFASEGPWWEGDINATLFEAVLGYSRARGSARLLIAAMAALADERGVIEGLTTELLCKAAGISDRTYRRAHEPLLAAGELVLRIGTGGRGKTNHWQIPDPRVQAGVSPRAAPRRVAPPVGARPLVSSVAPPVTNEAAARVDGWPAGPAVGGEKGCQDPTLSAQNCPELSGVCPENRPGLSGVSGRKGGQVRTHSPETPAKTPAETPAGSAPYARGGREPQNPRTIHPPFPPQGGMAAARCSSRRCTSPTAAANGAGPCGSTSTTSAGAWANPSSTDRADWRRIGDELLSTVGESTYAIWLEPVGLIAVDTDGMLVVVAPAQTRSWLQPRFWRLIAACAERVGRQLRLADESETQAMTAAAAVFSTTNQKEAA